ncbi:hypothetical protein [Bacteroides sp.]
MKKRIYFVILMLSAFFIGCDNDNETNVNGASVVEENATIKSTESYTLFIPWSGDNEKVFISKEPLNAKVSELINSDEETKRGEIYNYTPKDGFVGTDYVEISTMYLPCVPSQEPEPKVDRITKIRIEVVE